MSPLIRLSMAAALLAVAPAAARAQAENEGQADLDKATQVKLSAKTMKDLAEVVRLLESALEKGLDEGNTEFAKNLLGSTLVQRGSAVAETIFKRFPPDPRWPEFRRLALADLEKGLKISPKQPEALYFIARLNLLADGDEKRAAEALGRALELLTEDEPALRAKALTLRSSMEDDPEKKLADLDEAVRLAPGDAVARRTRGLVRANLGKLEEALKDFDQAIELSPKHVPTHEARALLLAKMKKYDDALVSLDKLRELQPGSVHPILQKARIHVLQDNLDAALHELNQAGLIAPDDVEVLLLRAGVYQEMEEKEKAIADVDKVLKLKPNLTAAVRIRAMLLAGLNKLDQAVAELEQLRRANPKDVPTLLQLAMFYMAEKRHRQAIEAYSAVLAEKPDNWLALRGRGDARLNIGKHAQAIADYEKVMQLKPKDSGVLNNFAWVLATSPEEKLRDGRRAVTLATEACELTDYKQAHILSTLAAAYAETGDFENAVKWSEKGVEIGREDQKEQLTKELESYRAGNPWRELLLEDQSPEEKPDQNQPEEKEPVPKKPEKKRGHY